LLDVRIVGFGFSAVIPVILFLRLLGLLVIYYRRLLLDYDGLPRIVIERIDKRTPPPRAPSRSDPYTTPYRRRSRPERVYGPDACKKHDKEHYEDGKDHIYGLFHFSCSFLSRDADHFATTNTENYFTLKDILHLKTTLLHLYYDTFHYKRFKEN
jgi:hypothetical protein